MSLKTKTVLFLKQWRFCSSQIIRMTSSTPFRFIDVGANLVDEMYQGVYNGSKKHEPDLDKVLDRAWNTGVEKIFVTAGNLEEAQAAAKTVEGDEKLYSTIGVHPTRCGEFSTKLPSPDEYLSKLKEVFNQNKQKVIALGEFGLDYERTQFCNKETQKKFFQLQLTELGPYIDRPLFLHCRAAAEDLHQILSENKECFNKGGIVHSFDGSLEEMNLFLDLGLHIGINGCSLKAEDNCKVVQQIPSDRLIFETDAPWCGIRPSHFSHKLVKTKFEVAKKNWSSTSMYKARNEPQTILNVLEVVAALKEMEESILANQVYKNTIELFFTN